MKAATMLCLFLILLSMTAAPGLASTGRSSGHPGILQKDPLTESIEPQGEIAPLPAIVQPAVPLPPIAPGTYTIGAGGNYASLSAAVAALNANGVAGGGDVIFEFTDSTYADTGVTIGRYLNQSSTNRVIFRPASGVTARIRFSGGGSASNTFCVRMDSAVGITWDGSNSGGTDRSLTIEADTVGSTNRNGILIQRGSSFITLQNLVVKSNRRSTGAGADAVRITNVVTPAPSAANHDILIANCWLLRGAAGITAVGANTGMLDYNLSFARNLLGGAGGPANDYLTGGTGVIGLQRVHDVLIEGNEISGAARPGGSCYGLLILGAGDGVVFTKNRVHDLWVLSGAGAVRMVGVQGQETALPAVKTTLTVSNNFFYDSHNLGTGSGGRSIENLVYFATGGTSGSSGSTVRMLYNTFWYKTTSAEAPSGTIFFFDGNAFGGNTGSAPDSLLLMNNIAASDRDTNFTRTFLIFEPTVAANFNWISDHNVFYQTDIGAFGQYPTPWPLGTSTVNPTLADWQTISGNDLHSRIGNPYFVSALDPHIDTTLGVVSAADSVGTPIADITEDFDGDVRDAGAPDAGADEFTVHRYTDDLAALSIDYPDPTMIIAADAPFSPRATFGNPGSASQTAAPVSITIYDSASTPVYAGTASVTLAGYGDTAQATFTPPASLPAGRYTITATANLTGDLNAANDSVSSPLFVQASVSSFPYSEGFEAGDGGWITTSGGGLNDWVLGTPAKTQIAGAHGGTMAWVTKTSGNYSDNQESYLNAPILNLSSFSGILLVQFASNFKTEFNFDGGELQMSTDGGLHWTKVDSTLGTGPNFNTPNSYAWYNDTSAQGNISAPYWDGGEAGGVSSAGYATASNGWVMSSTALTGLGGKTDVRFRWHFSSDGGVNSEGWAIDDVSFRGLEQNDIALVSLTIPGYTGGPVPDRIRQREPGAARTNDTPPAPLVVSAGAAGGGSSVTIQAVVENFGLNPQTSYAIHWSIDSVAQSTVTVADTLGFGGVDTIPLIWTNPVPGIHTVTAYTQLAGDTDPSNDTLSLTFEVLAPNVVFYEGFNGETWPPAGWDTLNADGNSGVVTSWYQSGGRPQEGGYSARGNFNSANGSNLIDDWLITPNVGNTLGSGALPDSLTFYLSGQGPSFPDSLMVLVSTSSSDPDSFTTVLDYVLAPPTNYGRFAYPLPHAQNRYIAFRYLIYNGGPSGTSSDNIYLDNVRITRYDTTGTGVVDPGPALPKSFALEQNYPNPFNPATTIRYDLPKAARVTLTVYDILGREVARLVDEDQQAGFRSVNWNAVNVASGMYLYRIKVRTLNPGGAGTGDFVQTRKMMLLK